MKKVWEILVPTQMNNGKSIRARFHRVWDAEVRKRTGGLTVLSPNIKGEWMSPDGEVFSERMIPVRILCTEEEIHSIAQLTKTYYRQEAIMFYCIAEHVKII